MTQPSIIIRGKVSDDEEYQKLVKQSGTMRFSTENGDEVFWGILLNETYFIFCNNILEFFGYNIVGRVGIHNNRKMLREKTVEYFVSIDKKEIIK